MTRYGTAHVARRRLGVPAALGAYGRPHALPTALANFLAACAGFLARPYH